MRPAEFLESRVARIIRWAVSVAAIGWLVGSVEWNQFGRLSGIRWTIAIPAVALAGLGYALMALRWQVLLRAQSVDLPATWIHRMFWIGHFYNSFLPGGVAGDVVRFSALWKALPGRKASAAASLIADRVLGLAALLALFALAVSAHVSLGGQAAAFSSLLTAAVVAFVLLFGFGWTATRTRWWEPITARLLGAERAGALHDAAVALGNRSAALANASALSVAVWVVDFAAVWLLSRSVGLQFGIVETTVAAAAAYVAASLPISIGGHGVREGTLVGTLALLGRTPVGEPAIALLALAFLAVNLVWSLAGGLVQLVRPTALDSRP